MSISAADDSAFDILDISDGQLRFLEKAPERPVHLHQIRVLVTADALRSGWVQTRQCHYHLDQVSALQVVFPRERTRSLKIVRAEQIAKAWIEGASVQVEGVGPGAVLCITSEHRSLDRRLTSELVWRGGPFQRRFLDGYFPMHVQLDVDYPHSLVELRQVEPSALRIRAVENPGHFHLDTLFEGKLDVELMFRPTQDLREIGW